ncbi:hypothetical protein C8Q76DRAFT_707277 [Earliella scabrosa]|nr:hypothetical protein C8Q76DRAFT_707277 [Earliella scabrosa]
MVLPPYLDAEGIPMDLVRSVLNLHVEGSGCGTNDFSAALGRRNDALIMVCPCVSARQLH